MKLITQIALLAIIALCISPILTHAGHHHGSHSHTHDHDHNDHTHDYNHDENSYFTAERDDSFRFISKYVLGHIVSKEQSLNQNVYSSLVLVSCPSLFVFFMFFIGMKCFGLNKGGKDIVISGRLLRPLMASAIASLLVSAFYEFMPLIFMDKSEVNYLQLKQYFPNYDRKNELLTFLMLGIGIFWFLQRIVTITQRRSKAQHGSLWNAFNYLLADLIHNFADGIALAATYKSSFYLGKIATVGILFHELPHELADFAVMLKKEIPLHKILLSQLATALSSFLGAYIVIENISIDNDLLLAFVCGSFIYISLTDILPEILEDKNITVIDVILECLGFAFGILCIFYL